MLKECQVSKILFEPQQSKGDVTASGVQFTYLPPGSAEPIITTLRARKEVILSAGMLNNVYILAMSLNAKLLQALTTPQNCSS